jgi:hypothetical protein
MAQRLYTYMERGTTDCAVWDSEVSNRSVAHLAHIRWARYMTDEELDTSADK